MENIYLATLSVNLFAYLAIICECRQAGGVQRPPESRAVSAQAEAAGRGKVIVAEERCSSAARWDSVASRLSLFKKNTTEIVFVRHYREWERLNASYSTVAPCECVA